MKKVKIKVDRSSRLIKVITANGTELTQYFRVKQLSVFKGPGAPIDQLTLEIECEPSRIEFIDE